ncbi:hypothetical protein A2U01_0040621, partial [Trifolium medium]|nr:hypothetical protein [Trifolium medium]
CGVRLTCEVVLNPNVDDLRLPPRDPTVVSEPMVPRRVRPALCIENLPDKGGEAVGPELTLEGEIVVGSVS